MKEHTVVFEPGERTVTVREGTPLAEAAVMAGVDLPMACGGQGACGQCRVALEGDHGKADGHGKWVLACREVVKSDLVVDATRAEKLAARLRDGMDDADVLGAEVLPEGDARPLVRSVTVAMPPPSTVDNAADLTRLSVALRQADPAVGAVGIGLRALRALPTTLRDSAFKVTVDLADEGEVSRIVSVRDAAKPAPPRYGLAIDIGTTTVAVQLVDMSAGIAHASAVMRNAQGAFGEDVISRIIWSEEHPEGLTDLHAAVLRTINDLVRSLVHSADVDPDTIVAASLAGNATMTSFVLGVEARGIRRTPHIPPAGDLPVLRAEEIGLRMNPEGAVYLHPPVSGFVGGDITAGVVATGMDESDELSLLIDVGTNGEIVVGSSEWLNCCSCSAGPAFEGVGLSAGMQASRGAIEQVRYDAAADEFELRVIGDGPPVGICGTGVLETLATLFEAGVIDRSGVFNESFPTRRLRRRAEQAEFVLVREGEGGAPQDLVLTQADVDHLIRSKAAVHAGITVMLRALGLRTEEIRKVYIAGGFGAHLNLGAAVQIGMIPDFPTEKIVFAGNSSLRGAAESLMSGSARERVSRLARGMTYTELSGDVTFMDEYVAAMFLPHTDLSRFPSVRKRTAAEA